jgi:hypothetical protein
MSDRRAESKAFWDAMYESDNAINSRPFGDDVTYQLGADFIGELAVQDWGCGLGWFRRFAKGPYWGIDGSPSMFSDQVVDLRDYRCETPALFMRHVLEHNPFEWPMIVDNAVASFTARMVLVLHTPMSDFTFVLKDSVPPDISLSWTDLTDRFADVKYTHEQLHTETSYGVENVFYLEKP